MSDGSIEQHGGRVTFRYVRHFRHPAGAVWQAITDPDQIERWTGSRPEIDLRPGGQYVSYHGDGSRVVDRVTRVEAPRLFEHTFWAHVNPTALVTWELTREGSGCELVLTHSLDIEDVRKGARASGDDITVIMSRNGAGWHRLLDKLSHELDGTAGDRLPAWSERDQAILRDRYAAMLQAL